MLGCVVLGIIIIFAYHDLSRGNTWIRRLILPYFSKQHGFQTLSVIWPTKSCILIVGSLISFLLYIHFPLHEKPFKISFTVQVL